ncbi:MAG: hypothetical protein WBM47_18335 [Polyangiales bacterium]
MVNRKTKPIIDPTRRDFLRTSFSGMGWIMAGTTLTRCASEGDGSVTMSNIANLGALQDPDENGVRLPVGFTSRIVAQSGMPVGSSDYV